MLKNTSDHREEGENRQMKNFVNVDTRFQKSINLTLDTGDMALVNRYIPTRSSVSILKQYLTNIVRGQGEHATILIGPCRRRFPVRRRLSKDHGGDRGLFCESKWKAGIFSDAL